MNIKIQGGGGGSYSNKGSCFGTVSYLEHEDAKRMEQGQFIEPFFDQEKSVPSKEVTEKIDNNKAKLSKDDSKYYVITVSPSEKEIHAMGKTPEERTQAFKEYINNDVMQQYAEGFNKGMNKNDILYFGKIHHERKTDGKIDMHAHVIVSRKDMSNTKKISPQTNHKGHGNTGTVKGGFHRSEFYNKVEQSFDKRFSYTRDIRESFGYLNSMKNGTILDKKNAISKAVLQDKIKSVAKVINKNPVKLLDIKNIKPKKQNDKGLSL